VAAKCRGYNRFATQARHFADHASRFGRKLGGVIWEAVWANDGVANRPGEPQTAANAGNLYSAMRFGGVIVLAVGILAGGA
jgi:hypothetical protein